MIFQHLGELQEDGYVQIFGSLSLSLMMLAACSSGQQRIEARGSGSEPISDSASHDSSLVEQNESGLGESGGSGGNAQMGGGDPVSMFDYSQTQIPAHSNIQQTHSVTVSGQLYLVNELDDRDPFMHSCQLPNGDVVFSNASLTEIVLGQASGSLPVTETWHSPFGDFAVVKDELIVEFKPATTQTQIEQLIATAGVSVIFSDFTANPAGGNLGAYFRFGFTSTQFASVDAAYTFFAGSSLVEESAGNCTALMKTDYTQGQPGDYYYVQQDGNRHAHIFGVGTSSVIDMGAPDGAVLPDGNPFSKVAVAVFDRGVLRPHADFTLGNPTFPYKIARMGMRCGKNFARVESYGGNPQGYDASRGSAHSHGTCCAGLITAVTKKVVTLTPSVVGLAPQVGVFPTALWASNEEGTAITLASVTEATSTMRREMYHGRYRENVRVVSQSLSLPNWNVGFYEKQINKDIDANDRLYVGSVGNDHTAQRNYPGAFNRVLGVSGLWTNHGGTNWYSYISLPSGQRGSNYWNDASAGEFNRIYPVSGIYGFTDSARDSSLWYQRTTWIPPTVAGWTQYDNFTGTSAATPQVAALAALLYDKHPERNYQQITVRIIDTRLDSVESGQDYPIAGPVSFTNALNGW